MECGVKERLRRDYNRLRPQDGSNIKEPIIFNKNVRVCHLERSEAESKDLYHSDI